MLTTWGQRSLREPPGVAQASSMKLKRESTKGIDSRQCEMEAPSTHTRDTIKSRQGAAR